MTANDLANKLTSLLKSYIKQRGFVASGKLLSSINFTITPPPNFDIKLEAEEYIQYLDKGKLLDDFFATQAVSDAIDEYLVTLIDDLANNI
jgi:hypothetical protein